jgi:hypothetical protein
MNVTWAPFAFLCAVGVGRAALARLPPEPPPADAAQRHDAFRYVASDEAAERREAAKTFPTDLWSRDDDFHLLESRRAREWARSHHVRVEDALSAVDQGLRERWPSGSSVPLVATVPPCRPRAIY